MTPVKSFVFVLLAIAAVVLPNPAVCAEDSNDDNRVVTFSIRTDDGIVVADARASDIERWMRTLEDIPDPPSRNLQMLEWLTGHGARADSVRIYSDTVEVSDPTHPRLLSWKKTTVGAAVRSGEIPCIIGREISVAYLMIRESGEQFYFLKSSGAAGVTAPPGLRHTVFVTSSAYGNGAEGIFVDGVNYSKGSKGYNIVAFTPDGSEVASAQSYNFFKDPAAGAKMTAYLKGLPDGTYIASAIRYGPGVMLTPDAIEALHGYGSKEWPNPQVNSSHAMLGRKGWAPGKAIETSEINVGCSIIVFEGDIFADESQLEEVSKEHRGRIVVISGTGEDDTVFIYQQN
jgi:hypothetical protein